MSIYVLKLSAFDCCLTCCKCELLYIYNKIIDQKGRIVTLSTVLGNNDLIMRHTASDVIVV